MSNNYYGTPTPADAPDVRPTWESTHCPFCKVNMADLPKDESAAKHLDGRCAQNNAIGQPSPPATNWEPHPGQYVWVEGKLTENQPANYSKGLRVHVHGVGTGIAKVVKPVTEVSDALALLSAQAPADTPPQSDAIVVPSLWRLCPCKKHEDYESDCAACREEVLTCKLDKAYRSGFADAVAAERERCAKLEAKLSAIVQWLEKNQEDVFRRGLWDAINAK